MKCFKNKGDTICHRYSIVDFSQRLLQHLCTYPFYRDPELKEKVIANWLIPKEYKGHTVDFKAVVVFSYHLTQKLESLIKIPK